MINARAWHLVLCKVWGYQLLVCLAQTRRASGTGEANTWSFGEYARGYSNICRSSRPPYSLLVVTGEYCSYASSGHNTIAHMPHPPLLTTSGAQAPIVPITGRQDHCGHIIHAGALHRPHLQSDDCTCHTSFFESCCSAWPCPG